jgi:hypothetical protein
MAWQQTPCWRGQHPYAEAIDPPPSGAKEGKHEPIPMYEMWL